jgi:hypothetical protein
MTARNWTSITALSLAMGFVLFAGMAHACPADQQASSELLTLAAGTGTSGSSTNMGISGSSGGDFGTSGEATTDRDRGSMSGTDTDAGKRDRSDVDRRQQSDTGSDPPPSPGLRWL